MIINGKYDGRPINRTIITSDFWLAVVISVIIATIIYFSINRLIQERDEITHTYRVLGNLDIMLSSLREAEATQRTYLITGSENLLSFYQTTVDSLPTEISTLRQEIAHDPFQQGRLDELVPLISSWLDYLQTGLRVRQQQGLEAARDSLLADSGQSTFSQILNRIAAMAHEENAVLEKWQDQAPSSAQVGTLAFLIGATSGLSLLTAVFYRLRREVASHARAEEALTEERNLLRTLIDHLPDSIYIKDAESRFMAANMASVQFELGADTQQEIIGKTDFDFFPEEQAARWRATELALFQAGRPLLNNETTSINRKTGEQRWLLSTKLPLRDSQGKITGLVGINRDITERKRIEEQIRALNQDLQKRAAALEAANAELEAFSYSVSHDLRAPLRAIDGFSRILLEEHAAQLDAQAVHYLKRVRDNAQRMGQLIDDLLAFSRLSRQPIKTQSVPVAEVVEQALNDLRSEQEGRQIDLVVTELPVCRADPALLKQVYANLISNALKYTRKRAQAHIHIGSNIQDGEQIFFVEDNGVGFDMQYASKLFGVFQRLHSAQVYEGTGVGLAIVQRIIKRHNGRVWAVGEVDHGATFFFTLGEAHDG